MLISTVTWRALLGAGVTAVPMDAERVELRHEGHRVVTRVFTSPRPLNPSDISALADRHPGPGLLIVPAATAAARLAAEHAGWSWVVEDAPRVVGVLQLAGHRVELHAGAAGERRPVRARPGRVPWGSLTLVRRLIERSYATQRELAGWAGISQPRVSQTLAALAEQELVERTAGGWRVPDFDQLLHWWLAAYPGPGGISTSWYGLDQPGEQAQAVVRLFDREVATTVQLDEPPIVVSGDVAADLIAPWRNPARAVVYARTGADLTAAGLTPAGEEEATLEFNVPRDPGVWPLRPLQAAAGDAATPLADPLQILWDVRRSPGPDAKEAAARLWQELRARSQTILDGHVASPIR